VVWCGVVWCGVVCVSGVREWCALRNVVDTIIVVKLLCRDEYAP
jgi:hypothetical protein